MNTAYPNYAVFIVEKALHKIMWFSDKFCRITTNLYLWIISWIFVRNIFSERRFYVSKNLLDLLSGIWRWVTMCVYGKSIFCVIDQTRIVRDVPWYKNERESKTVKQMRYDKTILWKIAHFHLPPFLMNF